MDAHRRCRPFYTSSGAHQCLDARRDCTKFYQYPVPSSYSSQPQFQVPIQKARLKSHPIANPHQPSPNVNDSAPRPLFLSAANVNDHRAATHQPLVAARKVLWTSKTLPGDHFSRYGHRQRPRCLLCSSSPTPHCLPGTTATPPRSPAPRPLLHTTFPGCQSPPPGALPLSRGAHSGAAGQRKTSTTTARLSGATIPSRR